MPAVLPTISLIVGDRQPNEKDSHVVACNDYMRLGPGRSLVKLAKGYKREEEAAAAQGQTYKAPTIWRKVAEDWSARYGWAARARAYDAIQESKRAERADEILNSGLTLLHERVHILTKHARAIDSELEVNGLYGIRKKGIKDGEENIVVKERVFKGEEIKQLRGLVDDVALEMGARQRHVQHDVTGLAGFLGGASAFDNGSGIDDKDDDYDDQYVDDVSEGEDGVYRTKAGGEE